MADPGPQGAPRPLTLGALLREAVDELLSLDRGLPWTFGLLWRRPRTVVELALAGDPRPTRPFRYLLLVFALASVALLALPAVPAPAVDAAPARDWSVIWAAVKATGSSEGNLARPIGYVVGMAAGLVVREYPHVALVLLAPLLAAGLQAAVRNTGAGSVLLASIYAVAHTYPLAVATRLLFAHGHGALALAVVALAFGWWCWFIRDVYRAGWPASLWRAVAALAFALFAAALLLLIAAVVVRVLSSLA